MSVNLDVGFCFYEQSLDTVKRLIESIKDHVRHIFAIDGKFEFFESDQQLSSPEIRNYLQSIGNVILVDAPNLKENEKRQIYLNLAKIEKTDFLLILDADCYVVKPTDWEEFYLVLEGFMGIKPRIFCIGVQTTKKTSWFPLLWYKPHLFQYTKTHNFWNNLHTGELIKSTNNGTRAEYIFIKSDDKLRTEEYLQSSRDYQDKLMKYEKPFKEEYRKTAINVSKPKDYGHSVAGVPIM